MPEKVVNNSYAPIRHVYLAEFTLAAKRGCALGTHNHRQLTKQGKEYKKGAHCLHGICLDRRRIALTLHPYAIGAKKFSAHVIARPST
jgi:hypothetical protein